MRRDTKHKKFYKQGFSFYEGCYKYHNYKELGSIDFFKVGLTNQKNVKARNYHGYKKVLFEGIINDPFATNFYGTKKATLIEDFIIKRLNLSYWRERTWLHSNTIINIDGNKNYSHATVRCEGITECNLWTDVNKKLEIVAKSFEYLNNLDTDKIKDATRDFYCFVRYWGAIRMMKSARFFDNYKLWYGNRGSILPGVEKNLEVGFDLLTPISDWLTDIGFMDFLKKKNNSKLLRLYHNQEASKYKLEGTTSWDEDLKAKKKSSTDI